MRPEHLAAALILFALTGQAGPGAAQIASQYPAAPYPPAAYAAPADPSTSDEIKTPARNSTQDVQHAASAPLYDINLIRQKIPPILLIAISQPYARPQPMNCPNLQSQIAVLNRVLGSDFDEPVTPQDPSLTQRADSIGLSLAHGAAANLLPFDGFIRTLSGAERHDQLVMEAITAGSVRRGYLKGLGEAYRCPPPATPNHLTAPRPVPQSDSMKPMYPIR